MSDVNFQIVKWDPKTRGDLNKAESNKGADASSFKGQCLWDCVKNMGLANGKDLTDKEILKAVNEIQKDNNIEDPSKMGVGNVKVEDDVMSMLGFEPNQLNQRHTEPAAKPTAKPAEKTYAQEQGAFFETFSNTDKTVEEQKLNHQDFTLTMEMTKPEVIMDGNKFEELMAEQQEVQQEMSELDKYDKFQFAQEKMETDENGMPVDIEAYKKDLMETAEVAVQSYNTDGEGAVSQQDVIDNQNNAFDKTSNDSMSSIKYNIADAQSKINGQNELIEMAKAQLEQQKAAGQDTTQAAAMIPQMEAMLPQMEAMKEQQESGLKLSEQMTEMQKKAMNEGLPTFAKNWASLDGDATSISEKDMAAYLAIADKYDGQMDTEIDAEAESQFASDLGQEGFLENPKVQSLLKDLDL